MYYLPALPLPAIHTRDPVAVANEAQRGVATAGGHLLPKAVEQRLPVLVAQKLRRSLR